DLDAVRAISSAVSKPVNVLVAGPLANHSVEELAQAGAARLSLGSTLMRHTLGHLNLAAREMLDSETFGFMKVMGGRKVVDKFMR
ncbi:MAG: isocitrate lyase/phosphoenolpyruvate mutase family protein, partial [Gammaproteobacteria bacterium]|nr:isocitrate lyase/phosphoenolpyruvate mutase family protein [Gammaproteobacteria bacterium]